MRFCEKYSDSSYIDTDGNHPIVKVRDKGSRCEWRGLNNKKRRVVKYRVDGGIITSKTEPKCDSAVYVDDDSVYLIELKGADYEHALEQIDATVDKLIISQSIKTSAVHGRVVLTKLRMPNLRYTKETSLKKKLKQLNGTFDKKTNVFEEEI